MPGSVHVYRREALSASEFRKPPPLAPAPLYFRRAFDVARKGIGIVCLLGACGEVEPISAGMLVPRGSWLR